LATNTTTGLNVNVNVNSANAVQGLEKINLAIIAIGATTALIGKKLSETASEFDKDMRNVNSIAQETEESYQKLYSKVRLLSDDSKIIDGPSKIAKGLYQVVSSGFEAGLALKFVAEASKSASAGLTSTEVAVTAVNSLMSGYNQKTLQDSIKFNDQLFRVVDKGVLSFEALATNLGNVIPVASAAGVSFETVGAMFIELTRGGISASEAQTAIAGLIKEISNPSPESFAWAKHLGVDISELALRTKGVDGVMRELGIATHGSLALMQKIIPEASAAKAALALAKDGAIGFDRALGEMKTSQGTRDKALEQQAKSTAFAYEKMKVSIEDLKIEYGKIINEAIVPLLKYLKDFIDYLKNLDQGTKETIVNVGLFTVALGSALIAVQGLIMASKGLGMAWALLEKHPIFLVLAGAAGTFYLIEKAVNSLKDSTNEWAKSLGKALDTINLFPKIKEYLGNREAVQDGEEKLKNKATVINNFDNGFSKFKRRQNSGETISLDDYKSQMKMLNEYYTYAKEQGGEARALLVKNERIKLNEIIKSFAEEDKLREESKKKEAIKAAQFAKQQEASMKEEIKRKQKLEEDKKRLENEVKNIQERNVDELASLQKEGYEHNIFLAEKEKNHNKKIFDEALKLKVISQKEYNNNIAQSQKVFHAKLIKMQKDLSKTLTDEYNQATKNKYELERIQVDNDFKEKKDYLLSLKKLGIDTKAQELQNKAIHDSKIKKIDEEQKKDKENDVAAVNQKWANATEMITKMNEKMNLIGKSDSEKRAINFKKELVQQKKAIEDFILEMSKQKTSDGKALYSQKSIDLMRESLEKSFEKMKEGGKFELFKTDDFENYSKNIALIDDKLKELNENPIYKNNIDFTPVDVIDKEKAQYENKIKLAQDFLKNTKNLTKEEILAKEREIKDLDNKIKSLKEKRNDVIVKAQKDVMGIIKESGVIDPGNTKGFDLLTGLIGKTKGLNNVLNLLKKDGLKGLSKFVQGGGDISGLVGMVQLMANQAKGMISAFTDNLRKPENFKDFLEIANKIAEDFVNVITLGALKGTKKLLGFKDDKEIQDAKNKAFESDLKMNKDREDIAFKSYNFQKSLAFKNIKDENERTQKIKELDFDLNNSLFALHKENGDLDIQLENNKLVSIQKSYDLEKETIEQSEGNWQTRAKKLELLFQQTKEKFAEQMTDIAKMDAKLNSTNEIEKMIKEYQADMIKINAQKLTEEERKRQQLSLVQDLGIKLVDTQKQGWKDLETLMSGYYDKEAKLVKNKHKADFDEIQIREQSIKSNQKQIDKMQSELDKIEAKFAKLLDNKTLSKAAKTEFDKRVLDMQLQEGGLNYNQLIRTPETEFNRKIAAKKEDINNQYEIDGNLQAKSDALKNLAVEQNVYWNAISKNIVQGTKEYDESVRNQYNSFKEFKDAVKDGIDAQKDFEETNFQTTNGVIDLKKEITNLTDKNKQFTNEINNYNNQIQSDLDILTSKFKNSAGEWETDLNKVRTVLSGITKDSALAINELDQVISKKMMVDNAVKEIVKDTSKPVTADNVNTNGWNNLPGSKIESNINQKASSYTDYSMPLTYNQPVNIPTYNQPIQTVNDNYSGYQNSYPQVNDSNVPNGTVLYDSQNQNAGDFFNGVGQVGQSLFDGALGGVTDLFDGIGSGINAGVKGIGDFFNGIGSFLGFANGGISDGPVDGYFQKLHGRELVVNENQGDNLAYILRQANNPNSFVNNTSSYGGNTININGVGLSKNEILDVLVSYTEKEQQNKRLAYRGSY